MTPAWDIDPMVRKEFYGLSRHWWTYVIRTGYVGGMAAVFLVAWGDFSIRNVLSYSAYSRLGRELFVSFCGVQFATLSVLAVLRSSDLISREVRGKTLGILAITPLSAWRIVCGKWKSRVVEAAILVLSGLPILAMGSYLGGVKAVMLLKVAALTLSMAMACTAIGIYCSSLTRLPFLGAFLTLILVGISMAVGLPQGAWVHPLYALVGLLEPRMGIHPDTWITSSASALAVTPLFLWLASLQVGALFRFEPGTPAVRRFFFGMDRLFEKGPLGRKLWTGRSGVWGWDPFLWKEVRAHLGGKLRNLTRLTLALCLVLLLGLLVLSRFDIPRVVGLYSAVVCGIIMTLLFLGAALVGADSFAREKGEQRWEILLSAPVHPGRMLWAKYAGAWVGVAPLALTMIFMGLMAMFLNGMPVYQLLPVLAVSFAFGNFAIATGIFSSLFFRTLGQAFTATTLFVLGCLVGLPFLLEDSYGSARERDLCVVSPFYHLKILVVDQPGRHADFWSEQSVPGALILFIFYGIAALIFLLLVTVRLNRIVYPLGRMDWPERRA